MKTKQGKLSKNEIAKKALQNIDGLTRKEAFASAGRVITKCKKRNKSNHQT